MSDVMLMVAGIYTAGIIVEIMLGAALLSMGQRRSGWLLIACSPISYGATVVLWLVGRYNIDWLIEGTRE